MIATALPVRKSVYSGRRKQKVIEPTIVSDEESVEDESVTRCVCGESHSIGLMVCCDECEVWQHCECMGLEEEDIPEQYFCELCKPSDHVQVKGYDNKTRRYYKPSSPVAVHAKTPKKRTTLNSREASIGLEEVLAFREAVEQSKTKKKKSIEKPTVLQDYDDDNGLKRVKRNHNNHLKKPEIRKKSRPRVSNTPKNASTNTPLSSSNNSTTNSHHSPHSRQKQRSRTSTPQPESIQTPTSCSSQLFDHFSQSARETSPPAKVRLPSQRMTILEMNRRANQILEYICSMQVEMATSKRPKEHTHPEEEDDELLEAQQLQKRRQLVDAQISEAMTKAALELDKENKRPTPILIPGQYDPSSPSSSLSSASTIPLMEDDEKGVAEEALERMRNPREQSSMEIMDLLTRQVITFQRRFGPLCYSNRSSIDESEESDGPVTRSRESRSLLDRNW